MGSMVQTIECDLLSFASVKKAAAQVEKTVRRYGGLSVLALNAGIASGKDERTVDGFDLTMQTNWLSHYILSVMLMPSLELAASLHGEARLIFHSSLARVGDPLAEEYLIPSKPGTLGGNSDEE